MCSLTITLVYCALFVFYFNFYVGVLSTICFLLSLFDVLRKRWCFAHYLFSTCANTLVFCALFVFYFKYYVGVLRTNCFLLSLLRWCFAHYLFLTFIITLVFVHYLFSTLTNRWVFCALFVFYFYY